MVFRRPAKAQASLRIRAVLPEPLLFAYMKYENRQRVRPKSRHLAPLDGCAMHVSRMTLWKTKSAITSWDGSNAWSIMSTLYLVSVAEQAGLCLTWSHTSKDRFYHDMAQVYYLLVELSQVLYHLAGKRKTEEGVVGVTLPHWRNWYYS